LRGRSFVAAAAAVGLVVAATAHALVPPSPKVAKAVAEANRAARRSKPLLLQVTLTVGEGQPVAATGTLASHPTGLARLELKSNRGFVERHLLQGTARTASRDGQMIDDPRQFLPPFFLLQSRSSASLIAAMESFGIASVDGVLGRVGDYDCFVFGGRLPQADEVAGRRLPSVWVDLESYDVVQIDGADGVRFRFGPAQDFSGIRVPRWIEIESPGRETARLEILEASVANAPAAAFSREWLTAAGAR
jgi:hypothetical protein